MRDGDNGFLRVNMQAQPALLQSGEVQLAINKRFVGGSVVTRAGTLTPPWANTGWSGTIYGSAVFSNPNSEEYIVLALADRAIAVREGKLWREIAYPTGVTLTARVELTQAFSFLFIFRGEDDEPLLWDGTWQGDFTTVPHNPSGPDFISPIPNADFGVVINNRMLVPFDRDSIGVSDILEYTRFDLTLNSFVINQGSDDEIVAIYPYGKSAALVYKNSSTFALLNLTGTLGDVTLEQVSGNIGLSARNSLAAIGNDVIGLYETGVYRVSQILDERIATAAVPISEPMEPLFKRVSGAARNLAQGIVFDDYYFLALPIDGATANNIVAIYNTVTGGWEGWHTWPNTQIDNLLVTDIFGQRGLFAVDYAAGRVLAIYQGLDDNIGGTRHQIEDRVLTRAYTMGDMSQTRYNRATLHAETWNPFLSVLATPSGMAEQKIADPIITKNRAKYFKGLRADYVESNINNDFDLPYREDYSVVVDDSDFWLHDGVKIEKLQQYVERFAVNATAEGLALDIHGSQGASKLLKIEIEGPVSDRATMMRG